MSILNSQSQWAGKRNQNREEEAGLILVLQECAGDVDNSDITKLTVPPIHGNSHLRLEGGGVGSSPPEVHHRAQ
jgi:hypothetical protein